MHLRMGMDCNLFSVDNEHYCGDIVKDMNDAQWDTYSDYLYKHLLGYWRKWYGLNEFFNDRLRRKSYRTDETVYNITMFALDKSDVKAFSKEIEKHSSIIYTDTAFMGNLTKEEFKYHREVHRKLVKKMKKALKKGNTLYYECSY